MQIISIVAKGRTDTPRQTRSLRNPLTRTARIMIGNDTPARNACHMPQIARTEAHHHAHIRKPQRRLHAQPGRVAFD
jgi:hypothetical protein